MLERYLNSIGPDRHATPVTPAAGGIHPRRVTRPLLFAVPIALLSLLTACGDSGTTVASGTAVAPAGGSVLTASVGQGDAPVITLVDSAGAPVTTLKAGSYTVNVKDLSTHHNFHLTGTGVDEKTTVPDTKDVTWTVKLVAGTYTFTCDPHAKKMVGTFTVT